jgi:choline dehydrogenase-like flavoprotein
VLEDGPDGLRATGVEYRTAGGETAVVHATKEIVVSAGAVGSPQLLLLSGIGPKHELEALGITCRHDAPDVGKHLQDHLQLALVYPAPGIGLSMTELGISMGPDALRAPAGPLPADPADDASLPPELEAIRAEAERRVNHWATTGEGLVSSSLYEACAWYSTGLGDEHTHDAQLGMFICGYSPDLWAGLLRVDPAEYFEDPEAALGPDAESIILLANPVKPHSRGEIVLTSADPADPPEIRMNYFGDPHDLDVMVAVVRKTLEVAETWPDPGALGPLYVPRALAEKHGHEPGDPLSDELIRDWARHYSGTVYHLTSTCRIGDVVDARLRVNGVAGLRVADASVMPDVVSGNTNAPVIMIGEKAAELLAEDHGVTLEQMVGAA